MAEDVVETQTLTDRAKWIATDFRGGVLRRWAFDASGNVVGNPRAVTPLPEPSTLAERVEIVQRLLVSEFGMPVSSGATMDVLIAGAGAPQASRSTPCMPPGMTSALVRAPDAAGLRLHFLPDVVQSRPADMLEGDAIRVAGALDVVSGFDGVVLCPGTHTRWIHVSAGEIVSFRSFAALSMWRSVEESLLGPRGDAPGPSFDPDSEGFVETLETIMARPESLAALLSRTRAERLMAGEADAGCTGEVAAAFIGAELAAARHYWLGQEILLLDDGALGPVYAAALRSQKIGFRTLLEPDVTVAGFRRLVSL